MHRRIRHNQTSEDHPALLDQFTQESNEGSYPEQCREKKSQVATASAASQRLLEIVDEHNKNVYIRSLHTQKIAVIQLRIVRCMTCRAKKITEEKKINYISKHKCFYFL